MAGRRRPPHSARRGVLAPAASAGASPNADAAIRLLRVLLPRLPPAQLHGPCPIAVADDRSRHGDGERAVSAPAPAAADVADAVDATDDAAADHALGATTASIINSSSASNSSGSGTPSLARALAAGAFAAAASHAATPGGDVDGLRERLDFVHFLLRGSALTAPRRRSTRSGTH